MLVAAASPGRCRISHVRCRHGDTRVRRLSVEADEQQQDEQRRRAHTSPRRARTTTAHGPRAARGTPRRSRRPRRRTGQCRARNSQARHPGPARSRPCARHRDEAQRGSRRDAQHGGSERAADDPADRDRGSWRTSGRRLPKVSPDRWLGRPQRAMTGDRDVAAGSGGDTPLRPATLSNPGRLRQPVARRGTSTPSSRSSACSEIERGLLTPPSRGGTVPAERPVAGDHPGGTGRGRRLVFLPTAPPTALVPHPAGRSAARPRHNSRSRLEGSSARRPGPAGPRPSGRRCRSGSSRGLDRPRPAAPPRRRGHGRRGRAPDRTTRPPAGDDLYVPAPLDGRRGTPPRSRACRPRRCPWDPRRYASGPSPCRRP